MDLKTHAVSMLSSANLHSDCKGKNSQHNEGQVDQSIYRMSFGQSCIPGLLENWVSCSIKRKKTNTAHPDSQEILLKTDLSKKNEHMHTACTPPKQKRYLQREFCHTVPSHTIKTSSKYTVSSLPKHFGSR